MRQVTLQGIPYIEIDINTSVLLNDAQFTSFAESYNKAVKNGSYTGSLEDFCSFCLTVGANAYLLQFAKVLSGDMV